MRILFFYPGLYIFYYYLFKSIIYNNKTEINIIIKLSDIIFYYYTFFIIIYLRKIYQSTNAIYII